MKVARLYSFEDIRVEEMPIPSIGPKEALIKTKACGICSGDVMKWYIEKKAPLVLGHEPTGEIIETGKDVSYLKPGDRVFVHHHAPCFTCNYCRRGDYVHCRSWKESKIIPGGIAEYLKIPELNLENDTLKLPDNLSFVVATLVEPAACVVKSLKRARIRKGDTVLVIGLGIMGLLHIMLSKKSAGMILGADLVSFRLRKGIEAGADRVIDAGKYNLREEVARITNGRMAQVVIVGPNSADAMVQGLSCVSEGGTVVFFTPAKPGEKITIDPNDLYFKDISIVTSYSCGPTDTADALELLENGTINPEILITHRFFVEETKKAYDLTAKAHESIKCVVVFD